MTRPDHSGVLYVSLFLHPVSSLTVAFCSYWGVTIVWTSFSTSLWDGALILVAIYRWKKGICGYLFGLCWRTKKVPKSSTVGPGNVISMPSLLSQTLTHSPCFPVYSSLCHLIKGKKNEYMSANTNTNSTSNNICSNSR